MKNNGSGNENRWKKAVDKFRHALGDLVNSVRVRISEKSDHSDYLEEIATGKLVKSIGRYTFEFPMLVMSEEILRNHQITYSKSLEALLDHEGKHASTVGKASKGVEDQQAFIMDKKGNLYIGSHEGQPVDPENPSLSHASFLGGIPAEMAGMISIDAGKIKLISDNSGHYAPEPLDMYRAIKKIQEKMPGALDKNCLILIIQNKEPEPLKNFVAKMVEKVQGTGGKTYYEQLRENRISKIKEYQAKLKNVSKKIAVT
ncbi:MAG TPA: hypothetical protein LFW14_02675 [Rickettsia endosymbiont of Degeeriella rufa]|nr:hypothetical protein [Rickettsia endosymbiont of Degeeriella rufa]